MDKKKHNLSYYSLLNEEHIVPIVRRELGFVLLSYPWELLGIASQEGLSGVDYHL